MVEGGNALGQPELAKGYITRRREIQRCEANIIEIVIGTLKGYDQLMNLVLDDVQETLRGLLLLLTIDL